MRSFVGTLVLVLVFALSTAGTALAGGGKGFGTPTGGGKGFSVPDGGGKGFP